MATDPEFFDAIKQLIEAQNRLRAIENRHLADRRKMHPDMADVALMAEFQRFRDNKPTAKLAEAVPPYDHLRKPVKRRDGTIENRGDPDGTL